MAAALGVLPYTHLEGEQQQRELAAANAAAAAAAPVVVARVSLKGGARRRASAAPAPTALALAAAALVVVAVAALSRGAPAFSSSSLATFSGDALSTPPSTPLPPPPPAPVLTPLPGNAPNCFSGGGDCARGLLLPLPLAATKPPPSSSPSLLDLVPKVVHLTVEGRSKIPCHMLPTIKSWPELNPGWRLWLWDAQDRNRLIAYAFPRWRAYYEALPAGVERADLFKYAVLSEIGGVYADIDAECRMPIDKWPEIYRSALKTPPRQKKEEEGEAGVGGGGGRKIVGGASLSSSAAAKEPAAPSSALILGIEAMHDDAETYSQAKHVYPLQLSAWTVLASPDHPALGEKGDALFPASQAEAARELLALFSEEENARPEKQQLRVLGAFGVRGGAGGGSAQVGGDFDDGDGNDGNTGNSNGNGNPSVAPRELDASARLWYRESILNRTGPFLLTREALRFALEQLDPPLHIVTHEDARRLLRNEDGFVGVARAGSSSSSPGAAAAVAILPLDAFGSGQPHSRAGPADGDKALVVHRFLSSWRGSGDGQEDQYYCEWKGL